MLFPLLLSISSRLAQIVPMALIATAAILLMALFAKKALLISLASFGLVIYDKFKKKSHMYHYHVTPSHKNYVNDKYYVTEDPHKYAVYSDEYHNSHRQKHNSGYLNDKYYVTEDPYKYAVYSGENHNSHRQKHNSGYLNGKYYVTEDPYKYAVYSGEYHSSHKQKHNSGYQPYGDDSDFILQQISAETSKWYQKAAMGT